MSTEAETTCVLRWEYLSFLEFSLHKALSTITVTGEKSRNADKFLGKLQINPLLTFVFFSGPASQVLGVEFDGTQLQDISPEARQTTTLKTPCPNTHAVAYISSPTCHRLHLVKPTLSPTGIRLQPVACT